MTAAPEDLHDLLPKTPWPIMTNSPEPTMQECIARRLGIPAYVQEMTDQARKFAKQNDDTAVAAVLGEAHLHMDFIGFAYDLSEYELDLHKSHTHDGQPFNIIAAEEAYNIALGKLQQSIQDHRDFITRANHKGYDYNTKLPAATSTLSAYSAALRYHLDQLATAQQDNRFPAEGHYMAAEALAFNADTLRTFLTDLRDDPDARNTPGIQRAILTATSALDRYDIALAGPARVYMPLDIHENIVDQDHLIERAKAAATPLLLSNAGYTISMPQPDNFVLQDCIIIMHDEGILHAKRITDEYPLDTPSHVAAAQAQELHDAARLITSLAKADLHTTPFEAFEETLETLAEACANPLTFHQAADIIFHQSSDLKDHYIRTSGTHLPIMGNQEQTDAVITAAVDAGLDPGPLAQLCKLFQADPKEYGINPPSIPWHHVEEIMESAREMDLTEEEAESLLRALDQDPDSPDATTWLTGTYHPLPQPDDDYNHPQSDSNLGLRDDTAYFHLD